MPGKSPEILQQAVTLESRFPDLRFLPNDHRWPELLHAPDTYNGVTEALERLSANPPDAVEQARPLDILKAVKGTSIKFVEAYADGSVLCHKTGLGTFGDQGVDYIFDRNARIARIGQTQSGHRIGRWTEFEYDDEGYLLSRVSPDIGEGCSGIYLEYAYDAEGNKKVSCLTQSFIERREPVVVDLDNYREWIDARVRPYNSKEKDEIKAGRLKIDSLRTYEYDGDAVRSIKMRANQSETPEHFLLDIAEVRRLLALPVTDEDIRILLADWRQQMPERGIVQTATLWKDESLGCSVELNIPSFADEMMSSEFKLANFFAHDSTKIWGPSPRAVGKPANLSWPEISFTIEIPPNATPEKLESIKIIEQSIRGLVGLAAEDGLIERLPNELY